MENVPGLSSRDKIKIIIITAIALFVSAVGISYAYFAIQITGNDTASSMRLTSANMQLIYTDVQIVSGDDIEPGWTETKTLTVQNAGNVDAYYTIIWRDLLNEITNDELVISATCVSTSGSCPNIAEKVIPTTTPEGHNINVKKNISIPVGVTHTYTVTIEFIETGSNQNYNQDKIFYGTLNIAEGVDGTPKRMGVDSTTGLPVVKIENEEFYDITNVIDYSSFDSTFKTKINYDSNKSILLAKYNLYVGQNCTNSLCTPISTSDSRYGLQSVDAKGELTSYPTVDAAAVVPFSGSSTSDGYWDAGTGMDSKYGTYTSYRNNIYDTNYATAPDYSVAFSNNAGNANYSIAYYVEEYVNTLGIEGTGRLLTYPEANAMTATQLNNGTYYWLGSADSYNFVKSVGASGVIGYGGFYDNHSRGIRPVIVIDTDDIETAPVRDGTDSDTGLPKVTIGSETFLDLTNAINYSSLDSTFLTKINYDASKSILLAKYNLYVGRTCTSSNTSSCTPISTSASGYGLQSADAKGYVDSSTPRVAVVPFSGSSDYNGYWYDSANSTIYSKYGTSYNASNIYDITYNTSPNYSVAFQNNAGNANYSIAYYVEEYVDRLGIEGEGRLLTYTEANAMTTAQRTNGARFWLGSANYDFSVGVVNTIGGLDNDDFSSTFNDGVRPVIIVSTSDIGA